MHRLFDNKLRNFTKPARRAETTYSFFDRSSLPQFERVRSMLERWVERLPRTHQQKTVANMRHKALGSARHQAQFNAVFFELFLHEFLLGTSGEVQVEPTIDGLTPDFRVTEELAGSSQLAYVVEATDIDLERGTKLERDWNELSAIDALNEIICPDFRLSVKTAGKLGSTPPKRALKRPFEDLAKRANYEELLRLAMRPSFSFDDLPAATFNHGNWSVVGRLHPVLPENRGAPGKFVLIWSGEAGVVDDIGKTRKRLYDKARRYENLDNLIIALRCDESNDRLEEVLFGSQQFTFYVHNDTTDTKPLPDPYYGQKRDGFWFNSVEPQNPHVSGVVAFNGVHPGTLDRTRVIFYSNPYADKPMPAWTKSITHAEYSDGAISVAEGAPSYKFLRDYEVIGNPFG